MTARIEENLLKAMFLLVLFLMLGIELLMQA
jgi:hypothetical protein